MALTADDLRDELDAQFATLIGDDYANNADREAIKAGMLQAIANAVTIYLTGGAGESGTLDGAEVGFVAGDFAGEDSASDTPDNITASGGTIT